MDNSMHFECGDVDGSYNAIKVEPAAVGYTGNPGESGSNIAPASINSQMTSYELQTNMADGEHDDPNQVVCVWESADEGEVDSSHLWTLGSSESASNIGQDGAAQSEMIRNSSLKPQKPTRLWPMGKLTGKKWQRRYSQRAIRQHKCTKCTETFLHKRSLHRHINIVHGPKVYFWCKRCCHFYNRRDNLRTHYRSHHPMYVNDVNHIQGVRRESLISEGLPMLSNPPAGGSTNSGGNSSKFGSQARKHQACQLTEREQGAVSARLENSRLRTVFVHTETDKTTGKGASQMPVQAKQSVQRPTPQKLMASVPAPPLDIHVSQPVRRPSAKAPSSSATTSRGHPMTVSDILTYQLQRDSNQAEEEVLVISEDSSSDGEPEPLQYAPVESREKDTVRLERGTPFKDLQVEKVMQGQVSRVTEEHQTFVYSGREKIQSETRKRTYNVLYLGGVGEGSTQHTPQAATTTSCNLTCTDALGQNIQGRVTKVTEMSSKFTYSAGKKVTKEKTTRVYDVMLLGGLPNM